MSVKGSDFLKKFFLITFIPTYIVYLILYIITFPPERNLASKIEVLVFIFAVFVVVTYNLGLNAIISYKLAYNLKKEKARILSRIICLFLPISVLLLLDPITLYEFRKFDEFSFIYLLVSYIVGFMSVGLSFEDAYIKAIQDGKYDWNILKNYEREKDNE